MVILDLMMADMDGRALARRIKDRADIPIMGCTGLTVPRAYRSNSPTATAMVAGSIWSTFGESPLLYSSAPADSATSWVPVVGIGADDPPAAHDRGDVGR